jgi:hypothetical protein
LRVGKWSIFEPKVNIMIKQVTILDHKILRILVPISPYLPYAVGIQWGVKRVAFKENIYKLGFFLLFRGFRFSQENENRDHFPRLHL